MYGWMALMRFVIFGKELPKTDPSFWFLMQIGMAATPGQTKERNVTLRK